MLIQRDVYTTIEAISSQAQIYTVVFDYCAGWLESWDEEGKEASIEIVDVIDAFYLPGVSVYNLLSNDEEYYIVDVLFAMLEDE